MAEPSALSGLSVLIVGAMAAVYMKQVNIFSVGDAEEVVLSSDGYPHLYSTLRESECYLADILEKDPLCMRLYKKYKRSAKRQLLF